MPATATSTAWFVRSWTPRAVSRYSVTDRIDRVLTNRIVGLPIFLVVMFVVFKLVVEVSAYFLDWVDAVISGPVTRWVSGLLTMLSAPDWLISLAVDGIIAGVGAVLVFIPGLVVLYLFLTLLEDSGYMARVAFVMDRVMRFTGLHGKSFMPMILGFGCAVPAIYSTRTLENRSQRLLTSLLVPLMSCSARLPVYVVFGMAFFGAAAASVITGLYVLGIVMAAIVGIALSRTILRDRSDSVFALELPPYRMPTLKALTTHTWQKTKEFVVKAGTVILVVSVLLWFLMSLPWGVEDQRDSYFGQVSAALAPVFEPAGFGTWEASGALVTGFIAKEVVVTTMAQAYVGEGDDAAASSQDDVVAAPSVTEDLLEIGTGLVAATDAAVRSTLSIIPGVDLMHGSRRAGAPGDRPERCAGSQLRTAGRHRLRRLRAHLHALRRHAGGHQVRVRLALGGLLRRLPAGLGLAAGGGRLPGGHVPGLRLMLARILATIRAAGQPLCMADLHRELDVDESALEGMLDTLVARGKLRAIRFDDAGCGGCPIRSGCFLMADGVAVTYALAPGRTA